MGSQSGMSARGAPHGELPGTCARLEAVLHAFRALMEADVNDANLTTLLGSVTEHACRLLSVDRCFVYLLDEETGAYQGELVRVRDHVDDRIKPLTAGVPADAFTREVLAARAPVVLADARSDPWVIRSTMIKWNVRSALGVPMMLRGKVIGLLYLDEEASRRAFTPDDVRV